jgi:hypothetical protein
MEFCCFERKWMKLEITMPRKISQPQKHKYHVFSLIYKSRPKSNNMIWLEKGLFSIEGISVLIESFLIYIKIHLTIEEWIYVWVYSIPLASILVFTPMPHSFDYCSFVVSFEIRKCSPPFFLFKDCFGILKFLVIPHTFHMDFLILSGITLNL